MNRLHSFLCAAGLLVFGLLYSITALAAGDKETPQNITHITAPSAPRVQTQEQADAKSVGCVSCHTDSDSKTMHNVSAVTLGCTDCHGGDASVRVPAALKQGSDEYFTAQEKAHVLPLYPKTWHYPHSANPKRSYTLLNKEAPEYIRFVNPSDYRVAREACGACHLNEIVANERSLMATGAMLWGGAAYNNGIVPFKNYVFGEAFTRKGEPATIKSPGSPHGTVTEAEKKQRAERAVDAWLLIHQA